MFLECRQGAVKFETRLQEPLVCGATQCGNDEACHSLRLGIPSDGPGFNAAPYRIRQAAPLGLMDFPHSLIEETRLGLEGLEHQCVQGSHGAGVTTRALADAIDYHSYRRDAIGLAKERCDFVFMPISDHLLQKHGEEAILRAEAARHESVAVASPFTNGGERCSLISALGNQFCCCPQKASGGESGANLLCFDAT